MLLSELEAHCTERAEFVTTLRVRVDGVLSRSAKFVTGEELVIDGGWTTH